MTSLFLTTATAVVMATAAFLAKLTAQFRRAQSEVDAGKANEKSTTSASAA